MRSSSASKQAIWTISALNFEVKTMLSQGIGTLWIEGEVSNFACPASGHWYFTLKDSRAQCRAAMFKGKNNRVGFLPKNGQQILIKAQVTLYEARGEYQLVVEHLEDAGVGELMRRYEKLKRDLEKEGLFSSESKRPLPAQPKKIGIVTSPTGAAIRDALSVIRRRAPHIPVLIFPTVVQGESAAEQILKALQLVRANNECDVLLLIRGGGSLEDMWCFNDERLAREIASFPIPVVTGIGHEIDFTIADFAADFRAPTPSVAAETVTPDRYELMQNIDYQLNRLTTQMLSRLSTSDEWLKQRHKRLANQHPSQQFDQLAMRLTFNYEKLLERFNSHLSSRQHRLQLCHSSIRQSTPLPMIEQKLDRLNQLRHDQTNAAMRQILLAEHKLAMHAKSLDTLSPLKTLSRGFAKLSKNQKLVSSVQQLSKGDEIEIMLSDGSKHAIIS
ncbi:MAG: exodeoxyribonuclease VII large subunit [Gammaproteobacteria bacterium]|jgi:exodeoxyribonuclease VII large subunit